MIAPVSWCEMRSTPLPCSCEARFVRSKNGVGSVKLKSDACATQSLSHPLFHPSTSTPLKPYFAAKSMYLVVFSVVAPRPSVLSSPGLPGFQVYLARCIPHQMPMYFPGLIHDVSEMRLGGFRLSVVWGVSSTISPLLPLIITTPPTHTQRSSPPP